MATKIRPELSAKNKYWISRHRYYELKHFCLQYPTWKKIYAALEEGALVSPGISIVQCSEVSDITAKTAIAKSHYAERIKMVEDAAMNADKDLYVYILKAVTEDLSFNNLKSRLEIPCGKDMYYDRYRRFFWLLSKERQ